jgi:AAA domain
VFCRSQQGFVLTGKTTTIVAMVCAARKRNKATLVVAPSNAAVANVARKLVEKQHFSSHNVVVWGDNYDESVSFLNPRRRYEMYRSYCKAEDEVEKQTKLLEIAVWLKLENAENVTSSDIEHLCSDQSGGRNVASASVLLCTLNTAGSRTLRTAARASPNSFELAVLDEASQCTEAEFYILTTFPGVRRIVQVGDPRQLGPTVLNVDCERAGYGESFLGNVSKYHPSKVHLLDTQYRMDCPSALLTFVNKAFYEGRLVSHKSVTNRTPLVKHPFLFVSTSRGGCGTEERQGFSWFNEYEAGVMRNVLRNDTDIKTILENAPDARVIVITPYAAQVVRLRKILKRTGIRDWDVGTVDSFQGQEADIVVVSTVRTDTIGFSDSPRRVCVSLTRARRVLRVIGDSDFFKRIADNESSLRTLALFAESNKVIRDASIDDIAWRRPSWRPGETMWKPTMVPRFHACLRRLQRRDRNIAFNTLYAVATPQINMLQGRPSDSESAQWQISALGGTGKDGIRVVWLPKRYSSTGDKLYLGIVEAHFAGKHFECNNFIQKHRVVPAHSACAVKSDLSGIQGSPTTDVAQVHSTEIDLRSWTITGDIQGAIIDNNLEDLPIALLSLDDQQERVLALKPPLLLESRSGTGKTNVLVVHALSYLQNTVARTDEPSDVSSILFVTVSQTLAKEQRERYEKVTKISRLPLPPISFLAFRDFLQYLVDKNPNTVAGVNVSSATTFLHYFYTRKSKQKFPVESYLVLNEVGGVIKGSLNAALKQRPLNLDEYMAEIRSNIPVDTAEGKQVRGHVYHEFLEYERWKKECNKYDMADIVLILIRVKNEMRKEGFASAYLDEVKPSMFLLQQLVTLKIGFALMERANDCFAKLHFL